MERYGVVALMQQGVASSPDFETSVIKGSFHTCWDKMHGDRMRGGDLLVLTAINGVTRLIAGIIAAGW